jgi:hypothetical protein
MMIVLPRQARDRAREGTKNDDRFSYRVCLRYLPRRAETAPTLAAATLAATTFTTTFTTAAATFTDTPRSFSARERL